MYKLCCSCSIKSSSVAARLWNWREGSPVRLTTNVAHESQNAIPSQDSSLCARRFKSRSHDHVIISHVLSHPSVFQGEGSSNMDGFYDQQVPFGVPESVSLNSHIQIQRHTLSFLRTRIDNISVYKFIFTKQQVFVIELAEMSHRRSRTMSQWEEEEVHGHRAGSGHRR